MYLWSVCVFNCFFLLFFCFQENSRLEDELFVVKLKLKEAEKMVNKLQCDLDRVLQDKVSQQ